MFNRMNAIKLGFALVTAFTAVSAWAGGNAPNSPIPGRTDSTATQQHHHEMGMGHMGSMMPMMGQRMQMMQQMMAQMHQGGGMNHNQMQHMQQMMQGMHSGGGCPMHNNSDPHGEHKN